MTGHGWSQSIWINSLCCRRSRAAAHGMTVRICPQSSKRLPCKRESGWCWPTPNSTARGSYLYSAATRSTERDSRQAREENLAHPRRARRDAAIVSAPALPASGFDRNSLLLGETQTLGTGARSHVADAEASSSSARPEFQSVSPEASAPFLEDVNRARWLLARGRDRQVAFVIGGEFDICSILYIISTNSLRRRSL